MDRLYNITVVRRSFQQSSDDWHATVTRRTDGVELIFIRAWLWRLKSDLRRKNLDKAFARYEERQMKLNTTYTFKR